MGPDSNQKARNKPHFLEFFAGSGLVAYALRPYFHAAWANDISEKKAAFYTSNHGKEKFHLGSIADVNGAKLPSAQLAWASFPCQDLSLAGKNGGIYAERSGLVWEWMRIIDEMPAKPSVLVAENVLGLICGNNGAHYRVLHTALRKRGYNAGAVLLDAVHWVPQSRPRIFVIAMRENIAIPSSVKDNNPNWLHPQTVVKAAEGLEGWVWWKTPKPPTRKQKLMNIIDRNALCDDPEVSARNIQLIPRHHMERLKSSNIIAAPGYKRTRKAGQALELRFDDIAGCLRTPEGGSSRQFLVIKRNGALATRLLTTRETARLMGAPESFELPGTYNDGYTAMGDAVAVPVARYLARHLLLPLTGALHD
jgi:DNA (cytosine-5)-methyltransferase 1